MQIDLDWIKKELDAGREVELECVDRIGFLKDTGRREANEKILDQAQLLVDHIDYDGDIRLGGNIGDISCNVIVSAEFKHFRIKESSATFDDLIDVAVQGVKDNIIVINHFDIDAIAAVSLTNRKISFEEWRGRSSVKDIIDAINLIESLYTETFVIESEEDYHSLKGDASIKLLNGETIKRIINYSASTPEFSDRNGRVVRLSFLTLKGATVTQNKARKEII